MIYGNTHSADMLYLVGMEIPDPFFYIDTGEKKYVFLDKREIGVFREESRNPEIEAVPLEPFIEEAERIEGKEGRAAKIALHLARTYGMEEVEVPTAFPLDIADILRSNGVKLAPASSFCPWRARKSEEEKGFIRSSIQRTAETFRRIEDILRESLIEDGKLLFRGVPLTSETLKKEVEHVLVSNGMYSAEGIVISHGTQAAMPHHRGSGTLRPNETIVCDIFPRDRATGYFGDMTRTYLKGDPPVELQDMYGAVLAAQEAALATVRPGIEAQSVHEAACQVFRDRGFDIGEKGFIHGTGHGLGLEVHEEPFVRAGSKTVLEPGHVITIEPGLYYPDLGGIRIEDVVYVTEEGHENLTEHPKEFVVL